MKGGDTCGQKSDMKQSHTTSIDNDEIAPARTVKKVGTRSQDGACRLEPEKSCAPAFHTKQIRDTEMLAYGCARTRVPYNCTASTWTLKTLPSLTPLDFLFAHCYLLFHNILLIFSTSTTVPSTSSLNQLRSILSSSRARHPRIDKVPKTLFRHEAPNFKPSNQFLHS